MLPISRPAPRPVPGTVLLAGLLVLAACDQGPSTVTPFVHPSGTLDFLISATKNAGPLYLAVDGSPFAGSGGPPAPTIEVMEQALQSRVLHLTRSPGEAEDSRFRLVLVFNPADKGELIAFCERQPAGGAPTGEGRVELRAGFCRGPDLLSAVDGWVEEVETWNDPRFEQLMKQVVRDLFSRRRKDE
jgi:hypothetical protein